MTDFLESLSIEKIIEDNQIPDKGITFTYSLKLN